MQKVVGSNPISRFLDCTRVLRHVLEDPAEVAEAYGGVHALGHPRRL